MAEFKNIKINAEIKKELDNIALSGESYNTTIQRLIRENKQLQQDKKDLTEIAKNISDDIDKTTNKNRK